MGQFEDMSAKLDEIVAKVNKVGQDLAAEIAAVGTVPAGGISQADAATLMAKLSGISDTLTAIDATMPATGATGPTA